MTTKDIEIRLDESAVELEPLTVTMRGVEHAPDDVVDAVEQALRQTIGHLMDGREVGFLREDDGRLIFYLSSIPNLFHVTDDGAPHELPAYRTREKFEGQDASGDGLLDTLPDDWAFEPENSHRYVLFQN